MNTFVVVIALSVVCCVYAQRYGSSSYDTYDNYDGISIMSGSRRRIGSGRLTGIPLLRTSRRLSRLPLTGSRRLTRGRSSVGRHGLSRLGRGRVYRPVGSRYINTRDSYIPRRSNYPTTY